VLAPTEGLGGAALVGMVLHEHPFLRQENERLGLLLDNRDDMLREA
jgi:hypothetical protein